MSADILSFPEIRRAGLKVLLDHLGVAGTLRFLQQFDAGAGDYTEERRQWLGRLTVDEIAHEIEHKPS